MSQLLLRASGEPFTAREPLGYGRDGRASVQILRSDPRDPLHQLFTGQPHHPHAAASLGKHVEQPTWVLSAKIRFEKDRILCIFMLIPFSFRARSHRKDKSCLIHVVYVMFSLFVGHGPDIPYLDFNETKFFFTFRKHFLHAFFFLLAGNINL